MSQQRLKLINASPVSRTCEYHCVAGSTVGSQVNKQRARIDKIDLIDADDGLNPTTLGTDQITIDQLRLKVRICGSAHNQDLIDVGDQHMLTSLTASRQNSVARFNTFDHSLTRIAFLPKQNSIACHDDIARITSDRPQDASNGTCIFLSISIIQNHHMQANEAGHTPMPASGFIDNSQQLITGRFDSHQRTTP
jgi:hypothetical protein